MQVNNNLATRSSILVPPPSVELECRMYNEHRASSLGDTIHYTYTIDASIDHHVL